MEQEQDATASAHAQQAAEAKACLEAAVTAADQRLSEKQAEVSELQQKSLGASASVNAADKMLIELAEPQIYTFRYKVFACVFPRPAFYCVADLGQSHLWLRLSKTASP